MSSTALLAEQVRAVDTTLLGLDTRQVRRQCDAALDHLDDEGDVELVDSVGGLVVVRVEALVGELLAEHDGLEAVVQEAGVVRTVLDRVVVGVVRVERDAVPLDVAEVEHQQSARTVAVLLVMDIEARLGVRAVADHVVLQHADHFDAVLLHLVIEHVGIGIAAPQTLLFAGEVHDAHGIVQRKLGESRGNLHDRDGTRSVIVGARSFLLRIAGPAGGGVEVSAHDQDLVRVLLARNGGFQVEEGPAAHFVGDAPNGDALVAIEGLDVVHGGVEAFGEGVAGADCDRLAGEVRRGFARELHDPVTDPAGIDLVQQRGDPGIGGRNVVHVDGRTLEQCGATDFFGVELATTGGVLGFVHRVEIVGDAVPVDTVVMVAVVVLTIGALAPGAGRNDASQKNNSEQQDDCRDYIVHLESP